jgi:hypothetical protein
MWAWFVSDLMSIVSVLSLAPDPNAHERLQRSFDAVDLDVDADAVADPATAVDRVRRDRDGVDCLVADPASTVDGKSVVVAARDAAPDLPIVLYAPAPLREVAGLAEAIGAAGYVRAGPDDVVRLAQVVRAAVAGRREDGWLAVARHDWDGRQELVSTLVPAVAAARGVPVDALDPLYGQFDAEAAEDVLASMPDGVGGRVSFGVDGRDVRVLDDGTVTTKRREGVHARAVVSHPPTADDAAARRDAV